MARYALTQVFHWEIETDDIEALLDTYEFPVFPEYVIGEPEYIGGGNEWEELEGEL